MMISLFNRFRLPSTNVLRVATRFYASSSPLTDGEKNLNELLKMRFPNARLINVKDTSCNYSIGSVYDK